MLLQTLKLLIDHEYEWQTRLVDARQHPRGLYRRAFDPMCQNTIPATRYHRAPLMVQVDVDNLPNTRIHAPRDPSRP